MTAEELKQIKPGTLLKINNINRIGSYKYSNQSSLLVVDIKNGITLSIPSTNFKFIELSKIP